MNDLLSAWEELKIRDKERLAAEGVYNHCGEHSNFRSECKPCRAANRQWSYHRLKDIMEECAVCKRQVRRTALWRHVKTKMHVEGVRAQEGCLVVKS